jgi:hypothetical protein
LFCLLGLLFSPLRDVPWIAKRLDWVRSRPWIAKGLAWMAKRLAWLRSRTWPWQRPASGVTP